jgi:hypothetical protein
MAEIVPLCKPRALACSSCGATAEATCGCGVGYVPMTEYVARRDDGSKSARVVAAELGVSKDAVHRARQVSQSATPEKRVGRDGKSYPATTKRARAKAEQNWPDMEDASVGIKKWIAEFASWPPKEKKLAYAIFLHQAHKGAIMKTLTPQQIKEIAE